MASDQGEGFICQRGLDYKLGTYASKEEKTYRKDPTL
jgi:hypothetical protein